MALQQGSGKYYLDTINGNVFIGTTAAAGVVPTIFSSTSPTFGLWNPTGSGRNCILISCKIGYVSTTAAASNFVYGYQTGVGSAVAAGGPVTAITTGTPVNALVGAGNASVAKFFPATATLTAGCSLLRTMGVSQLVTTAATTSLAYFQATEDFDGTLILQPGTLIVVGGNIAPLNTVDITMIWEEI